MKEKLKNYLKKECLITACVGLILGLVIMLIVGLVLKATGIAKLKYGKDTVAEVNGKAIKAETIYDRTKVLKGLTILIGEIDRSILDEMYTLTENDEKKAKDQADSYLEYYKSAGYTEKQILAGSGFTTYDEFLEEVKFNLKSNKYIYDFLLLY